MSKKMIFASLLALSLIGNSINAGISKPNAEEQANYCKLLILIARSQFKGLVEKATSKENMDTIKNLNPNQKAFLFMKLTQHCIDTSDTSTPWCAFADMLIILLEKDPQFNGVVKELEKSRNLIDDNDIIRAIIRTSKLIPNKELKKKIEDKISKNMTDAGKALVYRAEQNKKAKNVCAVLKAVEKRIQEKYK